MPFRKRLVNDGPLQHEVQAFLRQHRPAAQLQRISRKKLKGTIEKTLEATSAKAPMRNTGGRTPWSAAGPLAGLGRIESSQRPPGLPKNCDGIFRAPRASVSA